MVKPHEFLHHVELDQDSYLEKDQNVNLAARWKAEKKSENDTKSNSISRMNDGKFFESHKGRIYIFLSSKITSIDWIENKWDLT